MSKLLSMSLILQGRKTLCYIIVVVINSDTLTKIFHERRGWENGFQGHIAWVPFLASALAVGPRTCHLTALFLIPLLLVIVPA